jgi:hypothetical protein
MVFQTLPFSLDIRDLTKSKEKIGYIKLTNSKERTVGDMFIISFFIIRHVELKSLSVVSVVLETFTVERLTVENSLVQKFLFVDISYFCEIRYWILSLQNVFFPCVINLNPAPSTATDSSSS